MLLQVNLLQRLHQSAYLQLFLQIQSGFGGLQLEDKEYLSHTPQHNRGLEQLPLRFVLSFIKLCL
jgi:hypothetical protein